MIDTKTRNNVLLDLEEICYKRYYIENTKYINWWETPNSMPIEDEKKIQQYANKYVLAHKDKCFKEIEKANFFSIFEDDDGKIIIKSKENDEVVAEFQLYNFYSKNRQKQIDEKNKKLVESFLDDLEAGNTDKIKKYKFSTEIKRAKDFYNDFLQYEKDNKYKKLVEELILNSEKKHELLKLKKFRQNLFTMFINNFPLHKKSKVTNATLEKLLIIEAKYFSIEEIMDIIDDYAHTIKNKNLLTQYKLALEKFNDPHFDEYKYSYELFVGVRYDIKRLENGYKNINPLKIKKNAQMYKNKYLNQKAQKDFESKKSDLINLNKTKAVDISQDTIVIFKKISELPTDELVVDYLEKNKISASSLKANFNKFKKEKNGKYSTYVLDDIESKIDIYVKKVAEINEARRIINNVIDEIIVNPNKTKKEYFKSLGITSKEIEKYEKIVNKYFPKLYLRYSEKINELEKSEIDKIINKIDRFKKLGKEFTIFNYAKMTSLDMSDFIEKYYSYYPDDENNNIKMIMDMPFSQILSSINYIDENKYMKSNSRITNGVDSIYYLKSDEKKAALELLKKYNLPITNESCKEAAKLVIKMTKNSNEEKNLIDRKIKF